jgi:hypothetical protein
MEATRTSEKSVDIYLTTRQYIQKTMNFNFFTVHAKWRNEIRMYTVTSRIQGTVLKSDPIQSFGRMRSPCGLNSEFSPWYLVSVKVY